jgi:site-specific DNA-cytosine methylase
VRELTDREAFRLMDVDPDDVDKILEVVPSKYCKKLAGNSIVVNVMTEMFRNLFNERKNPEIPLF